MVMQSTKIKLSESQENFYGIQKPQNTLKLHYNPIGFKKKISQLSESLDTYSVDESTQKITYFLKLAAEKRNVKKFKTSSRNSRKEKDDIPWFDSECDTNKKALTDLAKEIKHDSKLRNKLSIQKKSFRKLIKCKKNLYTKQIVEEMNKNHSDPPKFWSLLNKLKAKESKNKDYICSISPFQWVNYFKNLLFQDNSNLIKHAIPDNSELSLNAAISVTEVTFALKQLKNKKAPGLDQLSNEMLKSFGHLYPEFLSSFFTEVFFENKFPKLWTTGLITPIFKKGPKSLVGNYRGIMLLSCLRKLLTKILNERLLKYSIQKNILAEEQIGFLRGNRTSDNLIILHSLVQEKLKSGKKLFACFVDFGKAFDKIPRNRLIEKLCNLGISGNILRTIENMYQNDEACIKIGNKMTESYQINMGVKQGDNPSPTLFNLYLSDLPYLFNSSDTSPPQLKDGSPIGSLLWADDLIILSDSEEGLSATLKKHENYCDINLININTIKTKCMIFNKKGRTIKRQFIYKSEKLEIVRNFTYLGFCLSVTGQINDGLLDLHKRAQKAFYKLKTHLGDMFYENPNLAIKLFDSLVKPVLLYASDFWGCFEFASSDNSRLEKLNTTLCKYL